MLQLALRNLTAMAVRVGLYRRAKMFNGLRYPLDGRQRLADFPMHTGGHGFLRGIDATHRGRDRFAHLLKPPDERQGPSLAAHPAGENQLGRRIRMA